MSQRASRRSFLKATGGSLLAAGLAPAIHGAEDKAGTKKVIIGSGDYQYECHHRWGEVPEHIKWKNTHGVAIDRDGLVYITHQGDAKSPCDTVVVFEPSGKFVRSFGKAYAGGGHGISIRNEGGTDYLYLSNTGLKSVVKCTTTGEVVWEKQVPEESGLYAPPTQEAIDEAKAKGTKPPAPPKYSPTNVCFGLNGHFYVGDGYGSNYIHQYAADGSWLRSWGGTGSEPGRMRTPHGQWLDTRSGTPRLIVADRANARLQYFTLNGDPTEIIQGVPASEKEKHGTREMIPGLNDTEIPVTYVYGLSFPADLETQGEFLLVPDLHARIILMNGKNEIVANLGLNEEWTAHVLDGRKVRMNPAQWPDGKFIHPHDACFDPDGNIYVTEWVDQGRVTFLKRI